MSSQFNPKVAPGGSAIGQQAFGSQIGAANTLKGQGSQLFGQGQGQLQQSGRYFSTMASGNRGAMAQQVAPEAANINDVYSGTAKTLGRFLRGPEKDVQTAELERNRAGQIGSLFTGGRAGANANLAGMGSSAVGAGVGATGGAGSLFGGAANTAQAAQVEENKQQQQAGQGFGGLFINLLKTFINPAAAAGGG